MRLAALAVMLIGCGDDPSLRVVVDHPQGLEVKSTTVTVYESPTLDCIDVAFARISAAELVPLVAAEQTTNADGTVTGELANISRVDHKVIVARGFDADGVAISGGCQQEDVIDGRVTVEIHTQEMVNISMGIPDTDPYGVLIAATDRKGKVVDGRRVGWTAYGPAGSMPAIASRAELVDDGVWEPAEPACTSTGPAHVYPIPPGTVGGYAVQMRVEWAKALPALFSSLTAFDITGVTKVTPDNSTGKKSTRFCAIRANGSEHRLVCLDGQVARDYDVTVQGGKASLVERATHAFVPTDPRILIAVQNGADRDVYAITGHGLIVGLFGATATPPGSSICPDANPCVEDALAVPACGNLPGKIVLRMSSGGLKQMDALGGNLADYPAGLGTMQADLDNAGCVYRLEPQGKASLRQVVTMHIGTRNALGDLEPVVSQATYGCTATRCLHSPLLAGAGVAFTGGTEPHMVLSSIDATGVVLVQAVLAPDDQDKDRFVERSRYPAASIPDKLVVGQFDTDGVDDLFWNIGARRGTTFEVAYFRSTGTVPLEALSAPTMLSASNVLSGKLTDDDFDDLVITEASALGQAAVVPIAVGVPLPTPTISSDSACPANLTPL